MWTRKKTILSALAVLVAAGGLYGYKLVWGKPFVFNHLGERALVRLMLADPETCTTIGMGDGTWLDFHSGKLTDASPRQAARILAMAKHELATLQSYDRARLDPQERLTFDVLRHYLEMKVEVEAFPYNVDHPVWPGPYPVNAQLGPQSELPDFMANKHRITNLKGAERYLARLAAIPKKFDQTIESLVAREALGVLPPRFILQSTLDQIDAFVAQPPEHTPFYTGLERGLARIQGLDPAKRQALLEQARNLVAGQVYPAYRTLRVFLQRQHGLADDRAGVWKLPNGDAYYRYLLKLHTTTDLSPEQAHALGLREVARLEGEIREALALVGLKGLSPAEGLARLAEDPRQHYPAGDEGRKAILEDCGTTLTRMEAGLSAFMPIPMPGKVLVMRAQPHQEAVGRGAWAVQGSLDGTRPGTFFLNLRSPETIQKFGLRTLCYHEGLPGHLYQFSTAQSLKHLPTVRRLVPFNAYSEGWASYTERLAWELGMVQDPWDNLGRLYMELATAVGLVVDTGLHHGRWSREEAMAYLMERGGLTEAQAARKVERYVIQPGQACAYMVGMLKLLELRSVVKQAQGADFDLKAFHRMVLDKGALPLWLLERAVREEAARTGASPGLPLRAAR